MKPKTDNYDHLTDDDLCGGFMPHLQNVYPKTDPELMVCANLHLRFQCANIHAQVCYDTNHMLHIQVLECQGTLCPIITDEIRDRIGHILLTTHGKRLTEGADYVIEVPED